MSTAAAVALADPADQVVVPTIALAEIRHAFYRGRIRAGPADVSSFIGRLPNGIVHPFDQAVLHRLPPGRELHDGIVVATALYYREVVGESTAVITADAAITASGLVDVLW